jgi:hypothetical protein
MKSFISMFAALMLFGQLSAQDYFPLTVGNEWVYKIVNTSGDSIGYFISTITRDSAGGMSHYYFQTDSFFVEGMGAGKEYKTYIDNGNDVLGQSGVKLYSHSIAGDTSWVAYEDVTIYYAAAGAITVPHGTHASCFSWLRSRYPTDTSYYAPNIGEIKSVFGSNGLTKLLTSYSQGSTSIERQSLRSNNSGMNFSVTTNPASSSVKILFNSNLLGKGVLGIYDVSGKMIKQYHGLRPNMTVSVSELTTGSYYMKLQVNNSFSFRKFAIIR